MTADSRLRLGTLVGLIAFCAAGLIGVVAVLDADDAQGAVALGVGVAAVAFFAGGAVACALACLRRGRAELGALAAIGAAGLAVDLAALALWLEIDAEAYTKVTAIAFAWTVYGLAALGLTLSVGSLGPGLARALYLASVTTSVAAGLLTTYLVATGGGVVGDPLELLAGDGLLRALGAALVLMASLWFAALSASRLDQDR